jgi:hypothetical protein
LVLELTKSVILNPNKERHGPLSPVSELPFLAIAFSSISMLPFLATFLDETNLVVFEDFLAKDAIPSDDVLSNQSTKLICDDASYFS